MDYSIQTLRAKHKRKDALVKRRYGKFMEQQSVFCDDVWNHIKLFMIDPFYIDSSMRDFTYSRNSYLPNPNAVLSYGLLAMTSSYTPNPNSYDSDDD